MNIIAFYLPQFHTIPENDEWWGKGFTEWVNVKKAKPLFEGHNQPRVPLSKNYYDLLDENVMKMQIEMAKKFGIYGFCFYHYWFEGKKLLEKPVENYLKNINFDFPFCLSWANEPWTNAWVSEENKILMPQLYGNKKSWKKHFDYLLPYFKDERYIKVNNMPLFVIYRPEIIPCLNKMLSYWQEMALTNGLLGINFTYQNHVFHFKKSINKNLFSYGIEYQPNFEKYVLFNYKEKLMYNIKSIIAKMITAINGEFKQIQKKKVLQSSYDDIWKSIISRKPDNSKMIPGAFIDWDNTPRKGKNGSVMNGVTPEKFAYYFKQQVLHARKEYKTDMIFIFAWNEWAEGGYLEPDERYGYSFLEAIKNVLEEVGEFPIRKKLE